MEKSGDPDAPVALTPARITVDWQDPRAGLGDLQKINSLAHAEIQTPVFQRVS